MYLRDESDREILGKVLKSNIAYALKKTCHIDDEKKCLIQTIVSETFENNKTNEDFFLIMWKMFDQTKKDLNDESKDMEILNKNLLELAHVMKVFLSGDDGHV